MKKLSIVLCVILYLSLLGGCSNDPTARDENSSSTPVADSVVSNTSDIEDTTTTTTTTAADTDGSSTSETTTTTTQKSPENTTSAPAASTTTTTSKTQAPSSSTTTTTTTTTTKATPVTPSPNTPEYITGIAIKTMPGKTTFKTGDQLDTAGLVLSRLYSDGSSDTISSGFTAMGFDSKTPGSKTVTIVYKHENGSTLTCTYNVKVEKKDHGTPNINGKFHHNLEDEVLKLLNKARKEAGLQELKMDKGHLMDAADIRAKEITIDFEHERPDHDRWDTVYDEEIADYNARGENLADGPRTAEEVFKAWMDSPGHKANIMEPTFTHISIACLEYNGHFYWVQLFGANVKR